MLVLSTNISVTKRAWLEGKLLEPELSLGTIAMSTDSIQILSLEEEKTLSNEKSFDVVFEKWKNNMK